MWRIYFSGAAAEQAAAAVSGGASVQFVSHPGHRDRGHVPLPHAENSAPLPHYCECTHYMYSVLFAVADLV